jgi:hypothetical protein
VTSILEASKKTDCGLPKTCQVDWDSSSYSCLYLFKDSLYLLLVYHHCGPVHNKHVQLKNAGILKYISTSPVSNHGYHNSSSTDPRILYHHSVSSRLLDTGDSGLKKGNMLITYTEELSSNHRCSGK